MKVVSDLFSSKYNSEVEAKARARRKLGESNSEVDERFNSEVDFGSTALSHRHDATRGGSWENSEFLIPDSEPGLGGRLLNNDSVASEDLAIDQSELPISKNSIRRPARNINRPHPRSARPRAKTAGSFPLPWGSPPAAANINPPRAEAARPTITRMIEARIP